MSEFQDGATYPQIKEYVLEHTGLKVSRAEKTAAENICRRLSTNCEGLRHRGHGERVALLGVGQGGDAAGEGGLVDDALGDGIGHVDLVPVAADVETVVLLSKGKVDSKKIRVEFSLEDMDMSEFQDGATYPQIKEYVLEHTGLKVSSLYISQVKRKCGLEVGKNYNLPKSVDSKQPQCPPEKEKAIREALKYFQMI